MSANTTARRVLRTLDDMGAVVDPTLYMHGVSATDAKAVVQAFPEADWEPASNGSSEWLTGKIDGVDLVLFLVTEREPEPSLGLDILKEVAREQ